MAGANAASKLSDLLPKMTVRSKETKGNFGDFLYGPVAKTTWFQVPSLVGELSIHGIFQARVLEWVAIAFSSK